MIKHLQRLIYCCVFISFLVFNVGKLHAQYCIPTFGYGTGEGDYLDEFVLEDIDNVTGAGAAYNDYTYLSTTLTPGVSYTITLYNTPTYPEYYAVWIDYNQDEVFDADEKLADDTLLSTSGVGTITFTPPFTVFPGPTRLRVICAYYPTLPMDPCGTSYYFGETEDYTVEFPAAGPNDLGITDINSLTSGCSLGLMPVTVSVTNFGTDPSGSFTVSYQVTDPVLGTLSPVTETYTGTAIASFATVDYTFATSADLSNIGDYTIKSYTTYVGDATPLNDTTTISVTNIPIVSSFPYIESFESGTGGWISGGTNSSWEFGYPLGPVISGPPPTTPSSANSWTTSLYGYYNYNEDSYVKGPCFDFSSLVAPYVKFDIWWETAAYNDGARLEYSLDGGGTWLVVGDIGTGDNWYNSICYIFYDPITFTYGNAWNGSSSGWKTAYQDLTFLAGESQVQLRFHFKSYPYYSYDGVAFDNFKVADLYNNDVGVTSLIAPVSMPTLGATETVTVNVHNFGLLPQSGFNVAYQIGASPAVSEPFTGTIAAGADAPFTFATTYDFSADGDYAFNAWTELATDEDLSNDTLHTTISNLLPISGTNAYYIYSNVYGGSEPFYTTSNTDAMNTVFGAGEWTQGYFETVDVATVFSTSTCFVWLEGSDYQASELENFLNTNITAIQNWVASGGHLFLNSSPNEGDGMNYGFGGVELNYSYYIYSATAYDPSHPIFNGPYLPVGTMWTGYYFSYATVDGGDISPLITDTYDVSRYSLAEKTWGAGDVLFGSMTPSTFYTPTTEATNLRLNILAYLSTCTISDIDMGITSITSPNSGCGLGDEAITVKVRNFGFMPQTNIPVNYSIDGGGTVSETLFATLDPGDIVDYTFTTLADLSTTGLHTIDAWTSFPGDTILSNDTTSKTINSIEVITAYPYYEDFEDGASSWSTYGTNNSWELGSPAGPTISGAPPATPTSINSWATSLTGYYNYYETSYVESPCFDFTSLILPYIQLDIWWDTYDYNDGAELQYSLDAGSTWTILGAIGTGTNWYTNTGYSLGYDPVTFIYNPGWVGYGGGWKTAKQDLTFLAGEPQVKFRMKFASSYYPYYDGIAFDNIKIQDPFANDVGVSSLVAPASALTLSSAETVTVNVTNYGTSSQTGFPVSYQVDGGAIYTETFTGTITAGATMPFTFAATADFSADGTYTVCSWTSLPGDEDISNDSLSPCKDVINLSPVTGTGAYYICSNVEGGLDPWYTTENQDAMNGVFGAGGWTQEFFETAVVTDIFNESTCFVFIDGSDQMAVELKNFLAANGSFIEDWVASGGNLLLNCAPNEGSSFSFGFGGVNLNYSWFTSNVTAADATHPIFIGPFTPVVADYYGTSFSHATVSGGGISDIIVDLYNPDSTVLAEKDWGTGHVLFGGMTTPNFHTPVDEARNLRKNMIDYLKLCAPIDLGVTVLISPVSGCGLTASEPITVTVKNYGGSDVTSFPIKYTLDGTPVTETALITVPAGGTANYTFTATGDFSAPGPHTLDVQTTVGGDSDPSNDLLSSTVTTLSTPLIDLGPNETICDEVTLDAGNPGSVYAWSTGATTQTIVITTSGTYSVTVTNPVSGCSSTDAVTVTVNYSPVASFTYSGTGLVVDFTNTSTGGSTYSWSFGDGSVSTGADPTHPYATAGDYTVTLTVTNACGSDFYTATISVTDAVKDIDLANAVQIYPNPTSAVTVVSVDFTTSHNVKMELLNTLGQIVWSNNPGIIKTSQFTIDLGKFADGVYKLNVSADGQTFSKQIVLTK